MNSTAVLEVAMHCPVLQLELMQCPAPKDVSLDTLTLRVSSRKQSVFVNSSYIIDYQNQKNPDPED